MVIFLWNFYVKSTLQLFKTKTLATNTNFLSTEIHYGMTKTIKQFSVYFLLFIWLWTFCSLINMATNQGSKYQAHLVQVFYQSDRGLPCKPRWFRAGRSKQGYFQFLNLFRIWRAEIKMLAINHKFLDGKRRKDFQ